MKQITVISGKGGTGKTIITGSLAVLAENKVMVDCDVDAADLHLLLHPQIEESHEFKGGRLAIIDEDKCTECGECKEVCRFEAITDNPIAIDPLSCEGCGTCSLVCPQEAITLEEKITGEWFVSQTQYGKLVHAKLGIAEENSGRLVTVIRQKAQDIALQEKLDYLIIDGPPGIGCPVIASLSGVDAALVVTEPTLSSIHDMERVVGVCEHFEIKTYVCINKFDLSLPNTERIENFCHFRSIPILAHIPFDEEVINSVVEGKPAVEHVKGETLDSIKNIWERLRK
ncbi:(4Fe-4S)-binding protein [candidate division KSB1 bacterium]|nr:MAG: (4Fe-4S)-binding protein [candidate division KSB1 bacterium]RKY82649.1 MAG: (4Fe-4S)-binding protein [candidate division KSB1 bacterium]